MTSIGFPIEAGKTLRFGSRAIVAARDTHMRFYGVNRFIDLNAGVKRGHLEIIVLRRWRILLQAA